MDAHSEPLLIIGAGISGLTLAQACNKEGIQYRIFERDESPTFRSAGWGLTLNWALQSFRNLLPRDIVSRLPETYVNRKAVDAGEKGSFTFFDLSNGRAKWQVPITSERIRVSRQRLRRLMLTGVNVEWSKTLSDITKDESGVTAHFTDGSTASGRLLVACDGAHSVVRRMLYPDSYENYQLPVRFIGASAKFTGEQVAEIRKLDGYFLQGSDPRSDAYLWFSFLETPGDPDAPDDGRYLCQVMTSWPYREGFFGRADPSNVPNTTIGQLSWMKALSAEWAEPFHSIVKNIPKDSEIKPVELADWIPQRNTEMKFDGRVCLLGDAAHAMVMYRGEGANHAIVDVEVLLERIRPLMKQENASDEAFKGAIESYEKEMVERTEVAVLASRQACLDAHDFKRLNDKSPLLRRRMMRADLEGAQQS